MWNSDEWGGTLLGRTGVTLYRPPSGAAAAATWRRSAGVSLLTATSEQGSVLYGSVISTRNCHEESSLLKQAEHRCENKFLMQPIAKLVLFYRRLKFVEFSGLRRIFGLRVKYNHVIAQLSTAYLTSLPHTVALLLSLVTYMAVCTGCSHNTMFVARAGHAKNWKLRCYSKTPKLALCLWKSSVLFNLLYKHKLPEYKLSSKMFQF